MFLLFHPLDNRKKIKILKKREKHLEILSFYTLIQQTTTYNYGSWVIERDRQSFCYFGLFFASLAHSQPKKSKFWENERNTWRYCHFTQVYQKWQTYDGWSLDMKRNRHNFFVILDHCLPLSPTNNPKNQDFQILKTLAVIIILHDCTKNHDHMLYCSWDVAQNSNK